MEIINNINAWKSIRAKLTGTIGFVPTMGSLHRGHQSLVERSMQENDLTVVSIFINPLQFNDPNDYQNYPQTLDTDMVLLEQLNVDYLFSPNKEDLYPQSHTFMIDTDHPYTDILEGKHRPGHFSGVLTIVAKLLNLIAADRAYFGKKDYQQYLLVKAMARDLFIGTDIIACDTIRENSNLPYSSRNVRLSLEERSLADKAIGLIHQTNRQTIAAIKQELTKLDLDLEYLEIKDKRVYSAIKINTCRIIDNFSLSEGPSC